MTPRKCCSCFWCLNSYLFSFVQMFLGGVCNIRDVCSVVGVECVSVRDGLVVSMLPTDIASYLVLYRDLDFIMFSLSFHQNLFRCLF